MFKRSPDAHFLALSSQDGYCTLVEFENNELGTPISSSGIPHPSLIFYHIFTTEFSNFSELDGLGEKKISDKDEIQPKTSDNMIVEATGNVCADEKERLKNEAGGKVDDMIIESTSNVGIIDEGIRKAEAKDQGDDMVIDETCNVTEVEAAGGKNKAREKADDMVIEETSNVDGVVVASQESVTKEKAALIIKENGNVGAVVMDSNTDKAEKQPASSSSVKSDEQDKTEKHPSGSDIVRKDAEEKTDTQTPSLDKREAEETAACISRGTTTSNKTGKRRITPVAIDQ